jgi:hypothetical protein
MFPWGKIKTTAPMSRNKNAYRYRVRRDVNRDVHGDKLLKQIGVTARWQLIQGKTDLLSGIVKLILARDIQITHSDERVRELLKCASEISDLAPENKHKKEPAGDKLLEILLEDPLSATQLLAHMCEENGQLRSDLLRMSIRQALTRGNRRVGDIFQS